MNKYIKAIRENVCAICVDSNESGECTLNEKETCAVEFYFPKILDVVHGAGTDDLNEIHQKLADTVCVECRASIDNGHCYLREDANCSLDRYFSVIVETIQKVDKGLIR